MCVANDRTQLHGDGKYDFLCHLKLSLSSSTDTQATADYNEMNTGVTGCLQTFHLTATDDAITCYLAMAKDIRLINCSRCLTA